MDFLKQMWQKFVLVQVEDNIISQNTTFDELSKLVYLSNNLPHGVLCHRPWLCKPYRQLLTKSKLGPKFPNNLMNLLLRIFFHYSKYLINKQLNQPSSIKRKLGTITRHERDERSWPIWIASRFMETVTRIAQILMGSSYRNIDEFYFSSFRKNTNSKLENHQLKLPTFPIRWLQAILKMKAKANHEYKLKNNISISCTLNKIHKGKQFPWPIGSLKIFMREPRQDHKNKARTENRQQQSVLMNNNYQRSWTTKNI